MVVGFAAIAVFLVLAVLGLPIAIALMLVSLGGLLYVGGPEVMIGLAGALSFFESAKYSLAVIPLFILMGQIAYHTGILDEVFEVAQTWLGRLRGGQAIGVVFANAIFAACSGSSIAACTVIGRASIPAMRRSGYPDSMSAGVVAASGTLASLIPPSIAIIIYGILVDESIGKLLIAGFVPGGVSAAIYIALVVIMSGRRIAEAGRQTTFREKLYSIRYLWVVGVIIFAIIGGIYFGICTPTEAGAVGSIAVIALSIATRRATWRKMYLAVRDTIMSFGTIALLLVAAVYFARFLTYSGFSKEFVSAIVSLELTGGLMFLVVTAVYFILGCFIGALGMLIITLPIFYPLMMGFGFNSLWFGIIVIKYCEMAFITPPVGVNLYAVKSLFPEIPLSTIIKGVAPFLVADLITIAVLYFFPVIVTFLPNLM